MARGSGSGIGWLVLAAVAWGTSGTLGIGLRAASGLQLLPAGGYRILTGGALILAFAALTRRLVWPRTASGWRRVVALALATGLFQVAFFSAIGQVGVAVATLVTIGSAPAIVLTLEIATGRHRLSGRLGLALAATIGGLLLLAGSPPTGVEPGALVVGIGLALVAGASFAGISLLGANPHPDFDDVTGTGVAFVLGGVAALALAATTTPLSFEASPTALGLLLALGLVPSAFAYLAYLRGLRTQSGTTGALVALLEPVTATVLATVVLGEALTARGSLGAALLLGAVLLTAWGARSSADPTPADTMESELRP
ncbi:MAG: DMT family transporter [Actinomycetes bacterium]